MQAYEQCNQEFRKQERYCKEQRDGLRALEDLETSERAMYELDSHEDQNMTVCKVALVNLVMWVRERYFPGRIFMRPGTALPPSFSFLAGIVRDGETVRVELLSFNDRQLNRDLATLCTRANEASLRLPDGHHLLLTLSTRIGHHLAPQESAMT